MPLQTLDQCPKKSSTASQLLLVRLATSSQPLTVFAAGKILYKTFQMSVAEVHDYIISPFFWIFFCRVINLENGLTALLISDTKSVTHCTPDNEMSVIDEDDDTCSEELDEESDSDDYEDSDGDNDHIDGVLVCNPEREQDSDAEQSRKSKDTKLVSTLYLYLATRCYMYFDWEMKVVMDWVALSFYIFIIHYSFYDF